MTQRITPFLWFDDNAEEAMSFYTSLFPNSSYRMVNPMGGTFILDGQEFQVLNGGPMFKFTEAISLFVRADTQDEIDRLWDALTADGGEPSRCGWLKDRYGLSWQIVPPILGELLGDPDPAVAERVMQAMLTMNKLDISALEAARDG